MPGLLQSITPNLSMPNYTQVPVDQGTNNLINQSISRASQTPQQFAQQQDQGVAQGAQMAQQSGAQASQQDAREGYSSGAVNQAIRNQYNAQAGARIQNMQDSYNQSAIFQKSAAMQQAAAEATARQNVTSQTYANLMKAYNDTETARAQVLQSILGAGGMAAGAYVGAHARRRGPSGDMFGGGTPSAGEGFDAGNIA